MNILVTIKNRENNFIASTLVHCHDKISLARNVSQCLEEFNWEEVQTIGNAIDLLEELLTMYNISFGLLYKFEDIIDTASENLIVNNIIKEKECFNQGTIILNNLFLEPFLKLADEEIEFACQEDLINYDEEFSYTW